MLSLRHILLCLIVQHFNHVKALLSSLAVQQTSACRKIRSTNCLWTPDLDEITPGAQPSDFVSRALLILVILPWTLPNLINSLLKYSSEGDHSISMWLV